MDFDSFKNILISNSDKYYQPLSSIKLIDALCEIKDGTYFDLITDLRNTDDDELWSKKKTNLPFYIFAGEFFERKDTKIKNYSYICVLDFDDLDVSIIETIKNELFKNKYIFAIWISPSGTGLKALIRFDLSNINIVNTSDFEIIHKEAYCQFRKSVSFYNNIQLDTTGSNISRMCYVSYDPNLLIKETFSPFVVTQPQITLPTQIITGKKHKSSVLLDESHVKDINYQKNNKNRHIMRSICKYLTKSQRSITSSYAEWYRIGQAIANCMSYSIGKQYYLKLCRIDGINHDEEKSKKKIIECYEQSVTYTGHRVKMRTIINAAIKQGWHF